ncbi:formate dehydrogenase subunit gamma [Paracoccus saliphilus]|uniref:Formate dehydrogenase gamma subunit n=1 Tax=Paracoccus saliphilus TaxID=405559 RepID=A0AA45W0U5_9RHOB|nr:formate dehydrogenase subunit gamma [Paracoccus saliphilus]WCR03307.1 formate dehydrogenase subunit gamma [Paracoccus saliphilus]SIS51131.1 formate dehydrogenase gamma subunit [Paracoccus saliphilus]
MLRHLLAVLTIIILTLPAAVPAQEAEIDRSATGGAQTLDDILRRQNQQRLDDSFRSDNIGGEAATVPELGPLGGASDSDLWRAIRYDKADITVSTRNETGKVLVQDGGMWWLEFREGPLVKYGSWLLLGTIVLLVVFYLLRGRVRVEGGMSGHTITRFKFIERMAHWLLAGSFILLGLTGLLSLMGRMFIAPYLGREVNASLLQASKFIHNNVAWAFMLGLVMVFVMWVWHNIPNRLDLTWFRYAGGIVGKTHPPAKKFNAGQKIVFWSVILLGGSISLSGLSLLFPYELPLFAKTFGILNDIGLPGWFGMEPLSARMSPQEEMQYAQLWHAIVAFGLMAVIIGHIYIGTLGMEGAFDAMKDGEVDEAWAHQHHSIWLEEEKTRTAGAATPAE